MFVNAVPSLILVPLDTIWRHASAVLYDVLRLHAHAFMLLNILWRRVFAGPLDILRCFQALPFVLPLVFINIRWLARQLLDVCWFTTAHGINTVHTVFVYTVCFAGSVFINILSFTCCVP